MPVRSKLALLFILAATPGFAEAPRSTRQMEALSQREAGHVVRHDLLSILQPIDKVRSGMFIQLRGVGLSTRPVGTEYENVCRYDAVTLWYAGADQTRASRDAPVSPYSITAAPLFHIVGTPKARTAATPLGSGVWQTACQNLGKDTGWFGAADAFHALQGALILERTRDAVRSGKLKAQPCGEMYPKGETCDQAVLAAGGIDNIDTIATCPADAGLICYTIDLGSSTKLTITARGTDAITTDGGAGDVAPGEILSVAVEQYIVVT